MTPRLAWWIVYAGLLALVLTTIILGRWSDVWLMVYAVVFFGYAVFACWLVETVEKKSKEREEGKQ